MPVTKFLTVATRKEPDTHTHTDKLQWKYNPSTISWRCNKNIFSFHISAGFRYSLNKHIQSFMQIYSHDHMVNCWINKPLFSKQLVREGKKQIVSIDREGRGGSVVVNDTYNHGPMDHQSFPTFIIQEIHMWPKGWTTHNFGFNLKGYETPLTLPRCFCYQSLLIILFQSISLADLSALSW